MKRLYESRGEDTTAIDYLLNTTDWSKQPKVPEDDHTRSQSIKAQVEKLGTVELPNQDPIEEPP